MIDNNLEKSAAKSGIRGALFFWIKGRYVRQISAFHNQANSLAGRIHTLDRRLDIYEKKLCPACQSWSPASLSGWELKSVRERRERRFQELLGAWRAAIDQGMTHKIWRTVGGSSVRATHMRANNQRVPILDQFEIGTQFLLLPSDPAGALEETANCRCNVRYVRVGTSSDTETVMRTPGGNVVPKVDAVWPTRFPAITSGFNPQPDRPRIQRRHTAIDIRNPLDQPVLSILSGVVKEVVSNRPPTLDQGAGNLIKITHADGLESSYSHTLSSLTAGQSVQKGAIIGRSDGSGVGPPHLHLVIRLHNERINPFLILIP